MCQGLAIHSAPSPGKHTPGLHPSNISLPGDTLKGVGWIRQAGLSVKG